jgi:hypothetical protein
MRSSQSHQRASNFVLERLKSQTALKYVWIDTRSQHATYFNNQHLNKTDRSAIEPRRRAGNRGRGATWRRCTIPIDPEMPSRPLAPRLGGLAQPRRSAPRPPGPLCRTNPATDRTFGWRECIVKKLAGINSSDDVSSGGSASVRAQIQHSQIGSERPCSRNYDEIRLRRREDTCRTLTIVRIPGRAR